MEIFRLTVVEHSSGRRVIGVHGELDLATMDVLGDAIAAAAGAERDVSIDLTSCAFIDSCGIRALVNGAESQRHAGLQLDVVCPPSNRAVARVIALVGLSQFIDVRAEGASSVEGLPAG